MQVNNASTGVTPATSPLDLQPHGKCISETVLRKLQSVERHFGSQNLQTPQPQPQGALKKSCFFFMTHNVNVTMTNVHESAGNALPLSPPSEDGGPAAAEAANSPYDGGFVIHCSQVYQRTQGSQQPGCSPQVPCGGALLVGVRYGSNMFCQCVTDTSTAACMTACAQTASPSASNSRSAKAQSCTPSHDGLPLGLQQGFEARSAGNAGDRASAVPDTSGVPAATSGCSLFFTYDITFGCCTSCVAALPVMCWPCS